MNAIEQARRAYGPAHSPTKNARSVEYQAFVNVISRLKKHSAAGAKEFPSLVAALHENRTLWTILAADVADPDNALPETLRAQIFYLAEFTDLQTSKILRGEGTADSLIEINAAVMRGLAGHQGPDEAADDRRAN
ncbi:flagellar biosynthesis regulator FlaF [Ponticoccus sp. SC2-23]|uniref:flagellar biosynthesis regulator FlaF n=1 Tax=Alexandriicola marinus TaxID=2081710 RepID=UPI000FDADA91|nr:flagellar biosynthesis regulator FlaF [Alexandriicola marinus]MBM1220503.1 flagellar biosynthesis regulator FlaF [Ponticoccus sp. SC6-9]MBM1225189.1 flagellar biosynthesis regulator FlaF [Ponticoccus sp. SC6-15]MBM1228703.1 flagellar biosynthesis regulator FlaF [Ponticoccus sp. SC6-38]MBM1233660.1 flagellar biosynthesis regulator FlaF [Ponticoccus sp. SC6-45]MBM1239204.1 flagellar biosynthesis regulator FlaF [Ponticoccus sp. SC6-49]MBM1242986.1 flagellar biosynthesis regulator FlaF [Pontic